MRWQIITINQLWDGPSFAVGEGGGLAQGFAKCLPTATAADESGAPTLCTDVAVVLLNRLGTARKLSVPWAQLRLPDAGVKHVRDVIRQADRPDEAGKLLVTKTLDMHAVDFLRITLTHYDDAAIALTGATAVSANADIASAAGDDPPR
eukprot:SAG31_NODE_11503_length_1023_cov_1.281385_1_plen_148_part_10